MGQLVFTFYSPKCIEETKIMINGATFEGELSKKSPVYHEIIANMSLYKTTIG